MSRRVRFGVITVLIGASFTAALSFGFLAIIERHAALWRIADLFFDVALLLTLAHRGRSLLKLRP